MKKLCVISKTGMSDYLTKGEIKERYYNPKNFFDEVHIITLVEKDVPPEDVKDIAGDAKLFLYPVGNVPFNPSKIISYFKNIKEIIKKIKPQVLRAYEPHLGGFLVTKIGNDLNIPKVISLHGNYDKDIRELSLKLKKYNYFLKYFLLGILFERYVIKNADIVICAYRFPINYAKNKGANDIELIYNRVDLKRFKPVDRNTSDKVNIICVGRLDKEKNQEVLINAVQDLDVNLTLIGDGIEYPHLQKLVDDLGISGKVRFIRSVPHSKIHEYYAKADIFAIGIKYGGVCIPVLEAMASSLPVVVPKSIWEDKPEIVGDIGMVVENTPKGFKEAFEILVNNPKLREELGLRGRELIMDYDGAIMEQREMQVYERILNN